MSVDEKYMRMAIDLALRAEGRTSPNPLVGAVIAKGGRILGKGYHKKCGLPHAEINAIRDAGPNTRGSTLFVNLEPCDHFGRTPPCTDAIIKSGVKKVVIGMRDPNPINNGRGTKKLRRRGIEVVVGILEEEARAINGPYIKFITTGFPFVTAKVAQSLDGKIATRTGDSRWITSRDARRYVHELRGKVDAVMVGANTVVKDDPLLTNRGYSDRQPVRIVVDSRLRIPLGARIFSNIDTSPLIIATVNRTHKTAQYLDRGAKVISIKPRGGRVDIRALLNILAGHGMTNILVEGGGELVASLVEARLVDRFLFFVAPKIIGGKDAVTSVEGRGINKINRALTLKDMVVRRFGKDILIEAGT